MEITESPAADAAAIVTGALLTGVLAAAAWGGADGLLAGNPRQFLVQIVAAAAAIAYSGLASYLLLKLVSLVVPLRVGSRQEGIGLDVPMHGEEAYTHGEGAILVMPGGGEPVPAAVHRQAAKSVA